MNSTVTVQMPTLADAEAAARANGLPVRYAANLLPLLARQAREDVLRNAATAVSVLDLYEGGRTVADFYANAFTEAADNGNHDDVVDLLVGLAVIADQAHREGGEALADRLAEITHAIHQAFPRTTSTSRRSQ